MISLTDEQNTALKLLKNRILNREPISILQGYAGTGKSTTLKFLIGELGYNEGRVHFCAYTGTAAKVLMDSGLNASTIHRLIYKPIIEYGVCVGFIRKAPWELQHLKLIVIDEYSMLPQDILDDLMSYDIPMLLVGDPAQLPPIGEPNEYIGGYHAILKTVHRQALNSPILWAATEIRNGGIVKEGNYGDILFVGRKNQLNEEWVRKDVQFLVGINITRNSLNVQISGSADPMDGDKIIFLKNDWNMNIVNGSITDIQKIKSKWDYYNLEFYFDEVLVRDYKAYYKEMPKKRVKVTNFFDKAYAITVHKSQGQTLDCPIVIIDESYYFREYASNWIYTAITRSSGKKPVAWLR